MGWMTTMVSTLFCATLVTLFMSAQSRSPTDLETEAVLPLSISFTPPSNRVRPGHPLVIRCGLNPSESDGGTAANEVSMFLHCPIAPWNSFCFQNCKSACIGVAPGDCPFENQLGKILCNTIVTQSGRVIYEYTIPELSEHWIYTPSKNKMTSKPPGFYCKSAGLSTVEVWATPEEPQRLTAPTLVIDTTKAPLPKPIDRLPNKAGKIKKPSGDFISSSKLRELDVHTSAILRELLIIGVIIIVSLSLLLNVFCCVRCALVRQYSRSKRRVLMQNLFCMAAEVETGRRINGLLPGKHVYRGTPSPFKETASMVEGNALLLGNLNNGTQNGSEYHQSVHLYPGVSGFSDNISNATGGEAPGSFIQLPAGRIYQSGNSGSAFSLPQTGLCHQLHHQQQHQQQQRLADSADQQSNATSIVTMPLYQHYSFGQNHQQQQQQLATTLATLQRQQQQQKQQSVAPGNVPTDMLFIVGPNGQPMTIVSGIPGSKARTSLLLESSSPPILDGVSLNSHTTNGIGTGGGDSQARVHSVNSNPEISDHRPPQALISTTPLSTVLQAQLVNHQHKCLDHAPNASHWSDSGNWSGGSAGPPPPNRMSSSLGAQPTPEINGIPNYEGQKQPEGDISLDKISDCQLRVVNSNWTLPRQQLRRTSGHVKRINHHSHGRRRGGASSKFRASPRRDLDVTTEDDASDWSASIFDGGENDTSSPQTTPINSHQECQSVRPCQYDVT